jgi:hypothetical protein
MRLSCRRELIVFSHKLGQILLQWRNPMRMFKILLAVAGLFLLTNLTTPLVVAREGGGELARTNQVATWWLGPEIYISGSTPASYEEQPAIAYNWFHDEYLVAWHNNRPVTQDIYVRRVSHSSQLLSWFSVSTASNCKYPAVATTTRTTSTW